MIGYANPRAAFDENPPAAGNSELAAESVEVRRARVDEPLSDRTALFLDVDGTMLDFVASPPEVVVPTSLVDDLASIERGLGGALALISGRTLVDLDRLFRPLRLRASGVHGAETRWDPSMTIAEAGTAIALSSGLWRCLNQALEAFPGAFAENKRFSFAVHYRAAPKVGPRLLRALRRLVADESGDGLEVIEAHYAFEIKGRDFDKGSAIERFLARPPFVGRAPIFVGDDWTDESGFAAVARRGGTAYSVGEARPNVSGVFFSPTIVRAWLARTAMLMVPP